MNSKDLAEIINKLNLALFGLHDIESHLNDVDDNRILQSCEHIHQAIFMLMKEGCDD